MRRGMMAGRGIIPQPTNAVVLMVLADLAVRCIARRRVGLCRIVTGIAEIVCRLIIAVRNMSSTIGVGMICSRRRQGISGFKSMVTLCLLRWLRV